MATRKLPPVRVDAIDAIVTTLEVMVVLGTIKVLAYRFHGHPLAQAVLVLF
jgi:hypothetical protein